MLHAYHAGKGQYGIETLTPEEQVRVREDTQNGFYGGRVFLCRDGVVINRTKVVRYRDIVWIRLLNATYTAALVPFRKTRGENKLPQKETDCAGKV